MNWGRMIEKIKLEDIFETWVELLDSQRWMIFYDERYQQYEREIDVKDFLDCFKDGQNPFVDTMSSFPKLTAMYKKFDVVEEYYKDLVEKNKPVEKFSLD